MKNIIGIEIEESVNFQAYIFVVLEKSCNVVFVVWGVSISTIKYPHDRQVSHGCLIPRLVFKQILHRLNNRTVSILTIHSSYIYSSISVYSKNYIKMF